MPGPVRIEPLAPAEAAGVEHAAKTEDLLLMGLDRYFAGEYQQAINVWTRILFLDRNHSRARAYIERARSALAEQQRESEELLHNGVAALNRGEIELARRLLTSSVDRGGPQELALPVLARLSRLEAAVTAVESAQRVPIAGPVSSVVPTSGRARGIRRVVLLILLVLAALGAAVLLAGDGWDLWNGAGDVASGPTAVTSHAQESLPLVNPGAIALKRARQLFGAGHLKDALRALEVIRPSDPVREEADRFRAEIQRELLRVYVNAESAAPATSSTVPAAVISVPE